MGGMVEGRGLGEAFHRAFHVAGAGAELGRRPVGGLVSALVGERRRRHQEPVGRFRHGPGEGPDRVNPVPMEAQIHVAASGALDAEPVDELGRRLSA